MSKNRETKIIAKSLAVVALLAGATAFAGPKEQATRMHRRLTGVNPSEATLNKMIDLINQNKPVDAAMLAIDGPGSAEDPNSFNNFYSQTLPRFFKPWFDEDDSPAVPLNDGIATMIGMTRDAVPFNQVLYQNIIYIGENLPPALKIPAFELASNQHYEAIERARLDLRTYLVRYKQTHPTIDPNQSLLGYDSVPAGVYTTRAWASEYYDAGTNRAAIRFTLKRFLCEDIEAFHDTTREDLFVGRDVTRAPAGDAAMYVNKCKGCHAGMDGLRRAFAYLDWDDVNKKMLFTEPLTTTSYDKVQCAQGAEITLNANSTYADKRKCAVVKKYLNNKHEFPGGYAVEDDSWTNLWTDGQNARVGWPGKRGVAIEGKGPKAFGMMIASSKRFSQCMAQHVYKFICLRDNLDSVADKNNLVSLRDKFNESNQNMKSLFANTASVCRGQ